jgi:xanthine/uracil permease
VLASALGWPQEQTTYLLAAGLLGSGVATLIQCLGLPGCPVGTRLPGGPGNHRGGDSAADRHWRQWRPDRHVRRHDRRRRGLPVLAGYWSRLLRFFPPLVTGTVITVIGVSLMPVAVMWLSGGRGFGAQDTSTVELGLGLGTLLLVLLIMRLWPRPSSPRTAILVGLVAGSVSRCVHGHVGFQRVGSASWVSLPLPFAYGMPTFTVGRLRGDDRDHAGDHGGVDRRLSRHRRGLRTTRR